MSLSLLPLLYCALLSAVFRAKVLESHTERLYGSTHSNSSASESDSSTESSPPPAPSGSVDLETGKLTRDDQEGEGLSVHIQHEYFMKRQIQLATRYKEKREQLPRTISSKRSTEETSSSKDLEPSKKVKLSSAEAVDEQRQQNRTSGPRIVSSAEKNRRRKLKKKRANKRLSCKS